MQIKVKTWGLYFKMLLSLAINPEGVLFSWGWCVACIEWHPPIPRGRFSAICQCIPSHGAVHFERGTVRPCNLKAFLKQTKALQQIVWKKHSIGARRSSFTNESILEAHMLEWPASISPWHLWEHLTRWGIPGEKSIQRSYEPAIVAIIFSRNSSKEFQLCMKSNRLAN